MDKELVKLAEQAARDREKRERERHEAKLREEAEAAAAAATAAKTAATTNLVTNTQIQVKPIIEAVSPDQKPKKSRGSYVHGSNAIDSNMTDDLLRSVNISL